MEKEKAYLRKLSKIPIENINYAFLLYEKMMEVKIPYFQDIDWRTELSGIRKRLHNLGPI